MSDLATIRAALEAAATPEEHAKTQARIGDPDLDVLGVRMGTVFAIAKEHRDVPLDVVDALLDSDVYEERMVGVSVLDFRARRPRLTDADREALYEHWMGHLHRMTAWDFIDRSAPRVVGWYLLDKPRDVLFELADSEDRWHRRTAVTAAYWIIRAGDLDDPLTLCERLAGDPEHLVQTTLGVALREIGRVDRDRLAAFLDAHGGRLSAAARRVARSGLT